MSYQQLNVGDEDPSIVHTLPIEKVTELYQTDVNNGLKIADALDRLKIHGYNQLTPKEKESIWEKIKEQFSDLLVRILLFAAIISFIISYTDDGNDEYEVAPWVEPLVIFLILILNGTVSIYQDYDAENALESLKKLQSIDALVLRGGQWAKIPSIHVVPGDIVQIQQGDKVPADLRLISIKTASLRVEESILTGESQPAAKTTEAVSNPQASLIMKRNILFSSTLISNGTAIGIVIATGNNTEIGKVNQDLDEIEEEATPLQKRLDEFGELLAKIIAIICLLVWIINIPNFSDPIHKTWFMGCLYYFKIAVALAVAAIPEGLPAVITTCLALGTRRMAKENAIVRKLNKVETLGCVTVICSDKTGTLTTNEMVVKQMVTIGVNDSDIIVNHVTGKSYQPEGTISDFQNKDIEKYSNVRMLAKSIYLNNESKLVRADGKILRTGSPTETALKVFVEKMRQYDDAKVNVDSAEAYGEYLSRDYERLAVLEFTSERKMMSTLCKDKTTKKNILFTKGAPDFLMRDGGHVMLRDGSVKPISANGKLALLNKIQEMSSQGMRVIAVSYKDKCGELADYDGPNHKAHALLSDFANLSRFEEDSIVIGILGIQDPPRPEVANAIRRCKQAGISVIMITGDHKSTAQAIGREIGLVDAALVESLSYEGSDFDNLDEIQKEKILLNAVVDQSGLIFARTEPRHKKMLVKALSDMNQIVAMTGDGVNDATALKQAQVGIAMGINGTEVAKEAAGIVLADDNFATIVSAVEEGRSIFANMKAFIRYMISSNIGEVVAIMGASLLGIPDAFNSTQLLWVNLVTDGLPATALSFNPPEPDIMSKPPRKHDEPIVTPWVLTRYLIIGTYVGIATIGVFVYWYLYYDWAGDDHTLITFSQLSHWGQCPTWEGFAVNNFGPYTTLDANPCLYFTIGKKKAATLSLTVIVVIEMFNALNALSDSQSLLTIGIFKNLWLLAAIALSIFLHCLILYIPFFSRIFNTAPLNFEDWILVTGVSLPVVIIDELLKVKARRDAKI